MLVMQSLAKIRLVASVICSLHLCSIAHSGPTKPNIIVLLIDDLGWGDFSCFGNTQADTPHIDQLADEGLRFSQFYVNSPICSPSRTALTTGQYPQRHRIGSYLDRREKNHWRGIADWLDPSAPSLARILKSNGYATGHFGKWHMGGQRDVGDAPLISEYGFDKSLTNLEGLGDRVLPLLITPNAKEPIKHDLGNGKLGRGKVTWMDRSLITKGYVDATIEFIDAAEAKGQPFYVNLWPDDVHSPFTPPHDRWGDGAKRTLFHAVLEEMDRELGRLFDHIRSSPELHENTVIVLMSDNGPEPGAGSSGPFRGHKACLYEGGIRSPLVVWSPSQMKADAVGKWNRESVLSAIDLVPSILEMAGANRSSIEFDGEPVAETLLGLSKDGRHAPIFFRRPPDRDQAFGMRDAPDLAVRAGQWKLLCEFDGSDAELYDVVSDPDEERNLAAENEPIVEDLTRQLLAWHQSVPADNGATYVEPRPKKPNRRGQRKKAKLSPAANASSSL